MPTPPDLRIALRNFIVKHFSREELFIFASDHFRDFYDDNAGRDLTNTALANNLLLHCERNEELVRLQACLQAARPDLHAATFGQVEIAVALVKQRNPRQVFLSHSHHDAALVRRLATDLRTAGLRVWMTPDDIIGSESWQAAIERGLSESGIFVVVLTPNAVTSKWVKKETLHAMQHDEVFKFVPVYAQTCAPQQLSLFLPQTQYVNVERDYDAGFVALCKALGVTQPGSNLSPTPPTLPPPPPPAALASKWQQRVEAALASQNWAEAARLINNWLELDPDDPAAQAAQARLRELQRAAQTAARAAQLRESQHLLDEAWADENWGEAARHAAIWLQLEPGNARAERALKLAQAKFDVLSSQTARPLTLAAGVPLEMVRIPAGEFLYGENKQKMALAEFWMGKTPVTVAQYWAFLQATKHPRNGYWKWDEAKRKSYLNHPAVDVNWEDATAFCAWASQATGSPIRLPSEQEWEKAARGTDGREYPWGPEAPDDTRCNFGKYEQWKQASGEGNYKFTTAVGSFSPKGDSPYKLQDMAGNVWEWCADWYDPSNQARVVRGGAFGSHDFNMRCAFRSGRAPPNRVLNIGFRVSASHLSNL